MNELTEFQIQKLPKWARDGLNQAIRERDDAKSLLKDYMDKQSPGPVYTRNGLRDKSFIQDDRVYFELKNGEVCVALRGDTLEVHCSYRAGGRLVVLPHVTNVIHLEIEEAR